MEETEQAKLKVIYILSVVASVLIIALFYVSISNQKLETKPEVEDYTYVSKLFDESVSTVVNSVETISKPYSNNSVKIVQNYYNYKDDEENQENSIISYDRTYIQNNGIAYGGINDTFDVLSIASGKVTSVKEDNLLGKVVRITHENNVESIYSSLSEVTVKEGDQATVGTIIGKSGEANINKDLGNHVLLEIAISGNYLNPEECYTKTINDLKSN